MQRLCAENCPHRWCFPFNHLVVVARGKGGKVFTFIVCAHCRHDVNLRKDRCKCKAGCHGEAREGRTYDAEWVAAQAATS